MDPADVHANVDHRQLVLVRHAKSAWDDPTLSDHDRPLATRGRRALPRLQSHLASLGREPDVVLCSSSRRTRDTLAGVRSAFPRAITVEVEERLYGASAGDLLGRLRNVDEAARCVVVIGHNPGLQDLAVLLAGGGDDDASAQLQRKFPTAAAVTISVDGDWADLGIGASRIESLFTPRRPRS